MTGPEGEKLEDADAQFAARLGALLPPGVVRRPEPRHLCEPRGLFRGNGGVLAVPTQVEQVARIVRACAEARVGIVPYGGGTGLVGGQISPEGPLPVILSLERMCAIRAIHARENVLVAEAGAILADVQEAAAGEGRLFPLSLASEGSARIGGLISTNAGGVHVLRYGTARELVLGLEAVLPDGTIWNGLKRLRKDNTGYDLRGLLAGAEGTLGVITAASLRLFAPPGERAAALMEVRDPAAALELLQRAQARLGEGVSAFELISGTGLGFLGETGCPARVPLAAIPRWSVLIEAGLAGGAREALGELFLESAEAGLVGDGVVSSSQAQLAALWQMREQIPEANRRLGSLASHDISLPLSEIPVFLREADAVIARLGPFRVNAFGHLGDGNLHYNVFARPGRGRADHPDAAEAIRETVHGLVAAHGGSFSAEHGIGRLKKRELVRFADPARLAAMRAIKRALDPRGIMNPGAVL